MGVSARAAHALSRLSRQVSAYRLPQLCNLGGMSMNIQRKNSAHHFRMQSEREQTLVSTMGGAIYIHGPTLHGVVGQRSICMCKIVFYGWTTTRSVNHTAVWFLLSSILFLLVLM